MPVTTLPLTLPSLTPGAGTGSSLPVGTPDEFSLYDVALGGVGFTYANRPDNPLIRQTAQYTKDRVDQEITPGEHSLSNWWFKSQDSFHGGAGQLNLEPPVDSPVAHVRFDRCKNVDPFTPGLLRRLPDVSVLTTANVVKVVGLAVAGADAAVALLDTGAVQLLTTLDSVVTVTAVSGVTSVLDVATDGARIYCATATVVKSVNPATPASSTTLATYPATATSGPVLGWAKGRLMLGVNGAVYQVDVSATGVTLGSTQLLLQHPTPGWTWRAFTDTPTAILAAGDAGAFSEVQQFALNQVSGAPTLQAAGTVATLPVGEQVLSLCAVMGSFVAVGTTRGVRVGQYDIYGRLKLGPLELLPTDPVIPAAAVVTRDRFIYAAGSDYDEAGLIAVDIGTQVDQAGRFAWAPHLVGSTYTPGVLAVSAALTPVTSRLMFAVPGVGLMLEGSSPGGIRESWLRTSRIRFGTTEPKLFKLGSVRADLTSSSVSVTGVTPSLSTPLAVIGFTAEQPDFRLPADLTEWLQLQFNVSGEATMFRSYTVKALPGTRRQVRIKMVLSIADTETMRGGQRVRDRLSARNRRDALEQLAAGGDEIQLQEFTPSGVVSTLVVVEDVTFTQTGRPTKNSDVGGEATVVLRTVDL